MGMDFDHPNDVLRALDQLFSGYNIYPPLMIEVLPNKWEGDVSFDERIFFRWDKEEGLLGVFYIDVLFEGWEYFEKAMLQMHRSFLAEQEKSKMRVDVLLPDSIIIIG
jgi:hypothetical protein